MKILIRKLSISTLVCTFIFLSSFTQGSAEDIEIYNRLQTEPNVLFIIDQSESMLQTVGSTGKTRDQIVKEAFSTVMSQSYDNLNVGFMDYGRNNGAGVDLPVADINQLARNVEPGVSSATETYASLLSRFANNLEGPQNNAKTALVESLLEAAKYYRGDVIDNLSQGIGNQGTWNDGQSRYTGGSWRAAGPRTLTTGATSSVAGGYCHQAGSPANAPHNQCNNIFPNSCQNLNANSGTNSVCTGGYTCTEFDITGTECVTSTCNSRTNVPWSHPAYTRCRETSSSTAKTYNSPIQSACTENFIVLLSDGAPTILGSHEQTSIQGFTGNNSCTDLSTLGFTNSSILSKGICGPDLTEAISTLDIAPGVSGTQTVNTYTIGFDLGAGANEAKTYLELLATNGKGQFFDANGSDGVTGLVAIFQNIFNTISQKPRVISRVATSLDLSNLGSSRPEVYIPMFVSKSNEPRWPGNLKGFNVNVMGDLEGIGVPPEPAFLEVDTDSDGISDDKIFNPAVKSFWSSAPDGADIKSGGVASLINPVGRSIKTENGSGALMELDTGVSALNSNPGLFGLPSSTTAAQIDQLISWANGFDSFDEDGDTNLTDARNFVGDALHSDPVVASYDTDDDGNLEIVTYFMTNEGMLHAIDATSNTSASEIFAFMPRDLLVNLDPLQRNVGGTGKIYGLDGPLVLFQVGGPTNVKGEKYLFFGMRRGGMNYYALNVTDPANPALMWSIKGGVGDFAELGQSWSTPSVNYVDVGGTKTLALIFGGGYDTKKDRDVTDTTTFPDVSNVYEADDMGRAVYIVDAATGAKLWSAGPAATPKVHDIELSMANAIPGDISAIDLNNDTYVDRLYFGDVGGHVWRIDIQGDITDPAKTSGYLLADLHDTTLANNRRFFSRPVAAMTAQGKLAVTIGSGNRAHPLETGVTNRFYTIFDPNPISVPSSTPSAINDSDLQDLTGFSTGFDYSSSTATSGWRINLSTDEKVFEDSSVLRGELFFSTYVPPTNPCSNIPDGANLYVLNLDGEPTRDLSTTPDGIKDAKVSVFTYGILPAISEHYGSDGRVTGLFGSNSLELYKAGALEDKFWTNNP